MEFLYKPQYYAWRWLCCQGLCHDDVIKWKPFPRYWPFVRRIHRSPVNSPHKGQWRGALMFSLICVWINDWVNNGEAGDLRRYRIHYDVTVMIILSLPAWCPGRRWWRRLFHNACWAPEIYFRGKSIFVGGTNIPHFVVYILSKLYDCLHGLYIVDMQFEANMILQASHHEISDSKFATSRALI